LNFYKKVLALRHTNEALQEGSYTALNEDDPNVMSYLRSYKGKAVLVALNMSASPQKAAFDLADKGFPSAILKSLLATSNSTATGSEVTLKPFGVLIAEVGR
jgi:glycosidase